MESIIPPATYPNADCICDVRDPFDPKARMPEGRYEGQCLNSCQQRSVTILSAAEAAFYGFSGNHLTVANISHRGHFWVAEFPKDGIEDVIYLIEYFPAIVPAAHTQLRFRFKPGSEIILKSQILELDLSPVCLPDIVYSVEAIGLPESEFDLIAGLLDRFAIAYRLVSLEDRIQQMIITDRHRVEQISLNLQPEEKHKLLVNAVEAGDRAGLSRMYNSFDPNCTTELFRALDRTLGYDAKSQTSQEEAFINIPTGELISKLIQKGKLSSEDINQLLLTSLDDTKLETLTQNIPTLSKEALENRHILGIQMPDLNDEIKLCSF